MSCHWTCCVLIAGEVYNKTIHVETWRICGRKLYMWNSCGVGYRCWHHNTCMTSKSKFKWTEGRTFFAEKCRKEPKIKNMHSWGLLYPWVKHPTQFLILDDPKICPYVRGHWDCESAERIPLSLQDGSSIIYTMSIVMILSLKNNLLLELRGEMTIIEFEIALEIVSTF